MGEKKRRQAAARSGGEKLTPAAVHAAAQAQALLVQGNLPAALENMGRALALAPHVDAYWSRFAEVVRFFRFRHPTDDWLYRLLTSALEHPAVDPGELVLPVSSLALSRPDGPLAEPLLVGLMRDAVLRDPELERAIVTARRAHILGEADLPLDAAVAIAHQCFNSEYVYEETDEETRALQAMHPKTPREITAYAAYRSLATLPEAERLAREAQESSALASLVRRQIVEPMAERSLRETIPALAVPSGTVSRAVQAQYEENPYPRWLRTQTRYEAAPLATIVRELFPWADYGDAGRPSRILVAGCGTGQNAIATAQRFAPCDVLAIDLSLASLAYAKRKTQELGIANIEYRQTDLLDLNSLPPDVDTRPGFDLVEASGVLHHLESPLAGWRVLAGLVLPGGLMRIGLYSRQGRRHVARARQLIAERSLPPTLAGIRAFRRAVLDLAASDALLAKLLRSEDFYSASGCRDLLFHVQEHDFALPEIATMLDELQLEFLGFEFPDAGGTAARYRARFPHDPRLTDLASWARYEEENPDAFARMYQFWVRKPA